MFLTKEFPFRPRVPDYKGATDLGVGGWNKILASARLPFRHLLRQKGVGEGGGGCEKSNGSAFISGVFSLALTGVERTWSVTTSPHPQLSAYFAHFLPGLFPFSPALYPRVFVKL